MESFEPVDVDKAGSEASEEGIHGLSKMVALFGYCTEFLNPGTTGICPERNPFDHVSLSDEETRDVKKELDDIDNKFSDARADKLKCSQ